MITHTLPRDGDETVHRSGPWSLKTRLREELLLQAELRLPITYEELAKHIAVSPQAAMVEIRDALEQLMDDDMDKGRPILAAVAVGGFEPGLPAPWFFRKVESVGLFAGDPADVEAYAFHARELHRAFSYYGRSS